VFLFKLLIHFEKDRKTESLFISTIIHCDFVESETGISGAASHFPKISYHPGEESLNQRARQFAHSLLIQQRERNCIHNLSSSYVRTKDQANSHTLYPSRTENANAFTICPHPTVYVRERKPFWATLLSHLAIQRKSFFKTIVVNFKEIGSPVAQTLPLLTLWAGFFSQANLLFPKSWYAYRRTGNIFKRWTKKNSFSHTNRRRLNNRIWDR
jgi:hypothetical protein